MRKHIQALLYGFAVVLLIISVIITVITVRQMPAYRRQLHKKIQTLQQLHALAQVKSKQEAAIGIFEALPETTPASLIVLSASHIDGTTPQIHLRKSRNLLNGWTLKQAEVIFNDVKLSQISAFLYAAETGRPPWRLTECLITPTRSEGGFVRAVLVLEALSMREILFSFK